MKHHYFRKQLFHPPAALIYPKPISPLPPSCKTHHICHHEREMEHLSSAHTPLCLEDPKSSAALSEVFAPQSCFFIHLI